MKASLVRFVFCVTFCAFLVLALNALVEAGAPPPPVQITREVTMSTREDYDKGEDLNDVALDFGLINDLGIDELVVSFGWDDYEPTNDAFDWTWLNSFCTLAATYGIDLRPYICYTPAWAGDGDWNSPPNDFNEWYEFCYELAEEMENHSNVVSIEIWNEWNDEFWWDGTFAQYVTLLENGHDAIDAVYTTHPDIISGGLVWPHWEAIDAITTGTIEENYEIDPLHCYFETWPVRDEVETYCDTQYKDWYVPTVNNNGEAEPIWVNECGYSTLDRTEADQAGYIARAVGYFFGSDETLSEIDHFCYYEIKDLDPNKPAIGDENNYHFGLTTYERVKKYGFDTYEMLIGLFDDKTITPANDEISVEVTDGRFSDEYYYLIQRSDGSQIVIIYDKRSRDTVTCSVTVTDSESTCVRWKLDNTSETDVQGDWNYDETDTISNIVLTSDKDCVMVFELTTP